MPGRRRNRSVPRARVAAAPINLGKDLDATAVNRAVDAASAVALAGAAGYVGQAGAPIDVDLVVGINRISHGLGRPVLGVIAMPRDASGSTPGFDPSQPGNASPQHQVWLTSLATGRYRLICC